MARLDRYRICIPLGFEPADLTVHPSPRTAEGGFIFSYRCLVFPKKCPQMKA